MGRPHSFAALARAVFAVSWLVAAGAAHATLDEPGSPGRAYLELRNAVQRATAPEAVMPYLSANYRRVVSNLPKVERENWLARLKRVPPAVPNLQAQAMAEDRCALGVVARDASHVKWSGRVEMVREGGAWKLADESWTTEMR